MNREKILQICVLMILSGCIIIMPVSACSDSEKICLERSSQITCINITDETYSQCVQENEQLKTECGVVEGGTCEHKVCSQPQRCENECLRWGCEGIDNKVVIVSTNHEEKVSTETPISTPAILMEPIHINDTYDDIGICINGFRDNVNNTNVYCLNNTWNAQKQDNESCQNSFECKSNFCNNSLCYDVKARVEENSSLITKIMLWFQHIFGE
jgi:hypothetical protein